MWHLQHLYSVDLNAWTASPSRWQSAARPPLTAADDLQMLQQAHNAPQLHCLYQFEGLKSDPKDQSDFSEVLKPADLMLQQLAAAAEPLLSMSR